MNRIQGGFRASLPGALAALLALSLPAAAGTPANVTAAQAREYRWNRESPPDSAPAARLSCLSVLDAARDRMVFFGGWGHQYFDDTWSLALDSFQWTRLQPAGAPPAPRLEHASIYDPLRDRMIVFGGKDLNHFFNDTWSLSLEGDGAWSQLAPEGIPPSPRETRAVYDPVRDRLLFTCGYGYPIHLNETWALSLAGTPAWTQLLPDGDLPPPRRGQSVVYDPVRDRLILFGGLADPTFYDDVWALWLGGDTPRWERLTPQGETPGVRYGHTAIYDPVRDAMVIFGGYRETYTYYTRVPHWLNDAWELSLSGTPTWSLIPIAGARPETRDFQATLYDPTRDRMILFGGNDDMPLGDLWTLAFPALGAAALPVGSPAAEGETGGVQAGGAPRSAVPGALALGLEVDRILGGSVPVSFTLPGSGAARLELIDPAGRRVRSAEVGSLGAGSHRVDLASGSRLASGMYFVRLSTPDAVRTRRVIVLD